LAQARVHINLFWYLNIISDELLLSGFS
jgi:hypothetical protein